MTEVDQLLSRLRRLEPIAPDAEFAADVQRRSRQRLRAGGARSALASLLVLGTVVAYLGWALHFTSSLYR
jgi:hypothetical protein